jgi:triacylglycerol esterase/lipase EstA (alpha/beta hydrolase family)
VGATPPNVDLSKPPIVFVQGMNGKAQAWWSETRYHGVNDMYEIAYQNGYRTAFVQLYDAAGNGSATPWDNGKLLAQMLAQIYSYFGQKVNIVAHSKGGPDTQAALVEYGAYPYVNKVVTLSSPHYGSNLANLAYSWWAGWLAELLGQQSPGVYSLQTGEMEKYRQQIDGNPNVTNKRIFYGRGR